MKTCEKCGLEYPDYFPECPDCGQKSLVWQPPEKSFMEKVEDFFRELFGIKEKTSTRTDDGLFYFEISESTSEKDAEWGEPDDEISNLSIKIPRSLHQSIKEYASRNKVTLKSIFVSHIEQLLENEKNR